MSSDKRLSKKVPDWARREDIAGVRIDSGPFIGIIKNNNDPIRSGRLQVWIPDLGGDEDNSKNWRTVSYASPFYGTTFQSKTSKNNTFNEVSHSYGMWAVPPDVGNQVICTFIAGDPNRGYWFACVNPDLSHYMVPGLAAGNYVDIDNAGPNIKAAYSRNDSVWPVTEFNQNDTKNIKSGWVNNAKPPHEAQVAILLEQGLDRDRVRGGISSSSQRESPSMVFGISTPGRPVNDPKDDPVFQQKLRAGTLTEEDLVIKSRKGGHTFVMDDGDQSGENQLIRLRTAGGHQILMNDSERVLYIANSDGTAWLEFTGGGHINVYSSAGMHLRTEGDFDIQSDSNINIEAADSIKIRAGSSYELQSKTVSTKASQTLAFHGGKITTFSESSWVVQAGTGSILTSGLFAMENGELAINGGKEINAWATRIDLNTSAPEAVEKITPTADLVSYKQNDVTWDAQRGLWARVNGAFETIVPTTPGHEPWVRGPAAEATNNNAGGAPQFADRAEQAKVETKQTGICEPQTPVQTPSKSIALDNNTYEKLVESELRGNGISDPIQIAAIMAQCSHESGNWKYLRELGNDAYFAKYEGRANLGNTQPGDGLKFKGRGFIQITGRDIYTRAGNYLGIDLVKNPELAEEPDTAAKLVRYFFFEYKKNATRTLNWDDIVAVTRIVNGGLNGINDRRVKYEQYKSKYQQAGAVTSGDGSVVVDGSGNPIQTGSSKLDPGPESAKGKPVERSAPTSSMTRADTPTPRQIESAGSGIPGLSSTQVKALMIQIGYYESELDYNKVNSSRLLLGRYQINGKLLKEYGYVTDADRIFTDTYTFTGDGSTKNFTLGLPAFGTNYQVKLGGVTQGSTQCSISNRTLSFVSAPGLGETITATIYGSWTGKDNIRKSDDWLIATGTQESLMEEILNNNYTKLCASRAIKTGDDICTVAGMMSVSYFFRTRPTSFLSGNDIDKARFWRDQGTQTDDIGVEGSVAFNHGRYAVDVLGTVSILTGEPVTVETTSGNAPTVDIDPDSVLIFTNRSGDRAHFNASTSEFKDRILQAARDFKDRTGRKLTISSTVRTQEEQTAIYDGWVASGGRMPDRPTVNVSPYGSISRPVKTVGNHGLGIAADIGVADAIAMEQLGILEKYGLYRFDPKGDPPHVQLKPEFRPSGLAPIQSITKKT